MVVEINVHHVYKYPVEFVARTHLTKIPHPKEKYILGLAVSLENFDPNSQVDYKKRIATCVNVIPYLLRTFNFLNEPDIKLQEECWFDCSRRMFKLKSRNLTWSEYGHMYEESTFRPAEDNPRWTVFEQKGTIDAHALGIFASPIEMFAKSFMHAGVQRSLGIMEEIMAEKPEEEIDIPYTPSESIGTVEIQEDMFELSEDAPDPLVEDNLNRDSSSNSIASDEFQDAVDTPDGVAAVCDSSDISNHVSELSLQDNSTSVQGSEVCDKVSEAITSVNPESADGGNGALAASSGLSHVDGATLSPSGDVVVNDSVTVNSS